MGTVTRAKPQLRTRIVAMTIMEYFAQRMYKIGLTLMATSPTPYGARFASGILRSFAYDEACFFSADGASAEIAERRRLGFHALAESFEKQFPKTLRAAETFLDGISDLRFTDTNRVPFPFQKLVREKLNVASLAVSSEGPNILNVWS